MSRDTDQSRSPLDTAVALLRSGHHAQAERWLDQAVAAGECAPAHALDLRARSYAQQGFLLEAERCWTEAQRLEPDNQGHALGLQQLRAPRRASRWTLLLAAVAVLAVVVGLHQVLVALPAADRAARTQAAREHSERIAAAGAFESRWRAEADRRATHDSAVQAQLDQLATTLVEQRGVLDDTLANALNDALERHDEGARQQLGTALAAQRTAIEGALRGTLTAQAAAHQQSLRQLLDGGREEVQVFAAELAALREQLRGIEAAVAARVGAALQERLSAAFARERESQAEARTLEMIRLREDTLAELSAQTSALPTTVELQAMREQLGELLKAELRAAVAGEQAAFRAQLTDLALAVEALDRRLSRAFERAPR